MFIAQNKKASALRRSAMFARTCRSYGANKSGEWSGYKHLAPSGANSGSCLVEGNMFMAQK
jgi:hypothetical protein